MTLMNDSVYDGSTGNRLLHFLCATRTRHFPFANKNILCLFDEFFFVYSKIKAHEQVFINIMYISRPGGHNLECATEFRSIVP